MRPFAQTRLPLWAVDEWRQATRLVAAIPVGRWQRQNGSWCISRAPDALELRCHEVARIVAMVLGLKSHDVVDGHYGIAEHSWIEHRSDDQRIILDCYAIARLPMVQLVDLPDHLPDDRSYRRGALRSDIRCDQIDTIISDLRQHRWWVNPVAG